MESNKTIIQYFSEHANALFSGFLKNLVSIGTFLTASKKKGLVVVFLSVVYLLSL